MKTVRKNKRWIYLFMWIFILFLLFRSSSMPYKDQSLVEDINKGFSNKPFENIFGNISFTYNGSEVSLKHLGYAKFIEFFIRKLAHFSTFGLLGFSIFKTIDEFRIYHGKDVNKKYYRILAILSIFLVFIFASLDEIHQLYTSGRTGAYQDVILDTLGGLVFIFITYIISCKKLTENLDKVL